MKSGPRILYLTSSPPFPQRSGGSLRAFAIWRALSACGQTHLLLSGVSKEVEAATAESLTESDFSVLDTRRMGKGGVLLNYCRALFDGGYYIREVQASGIAQGLEKALNRLKPDVVVIGGLSQSSNLPLVRRVAPAATVFVDGDNIWPLLFRRLAQGVRNPVRKVLYHALRRSMMRLEKEFLPEANRVFATSVEDARYYTNQLGLRNVEVAPNVLDMDSYLPNGEQEEDGAVVLSAWFRYRPNMLAALELIQHAKEITLAGTPLHLYLVGRDPSIEMHEAAKGCPYISITGEVQDVRPFIRKACVAAIPLRFGSGTKLKVLEAMALSRAVLTTPVGAEGLHFAENEHAVVRDDPRAFRQELRALLSDPVRRTRMGAAARSWVEQSYSIEVLTAVFARSLSEARALP